MESGKKDKSTARVIIVRILQAILVLTIIFVGYNLSRDRNTVKVDQTTTPTVEEIKTVKEEVPESVKRNGSFVGQNNYSVKGDATLVTDNDGITTLVLNNGFDSSSGPDLQVYLSKNSVESAEGLGDFVSLGELQANQGDQVYSVPDNIDEFNSVVIWCRAFSASFGAADLN